MKFSEEEEARRREGLGASESPAVLGVVGYETALDVWGRKTGIDVGTPDVGDEAEWGNLLEPVIVARYARDTGRDVLYDPAKTRGMQHPSVPILFASPDALDVTERRLLEVKVDRFGRGWGEPGTDEVPLRVKVQVVHQLEVTGYETADVAALIGGTDYRVYTIERNTARQAALVEALVEWWEKYVRAGIPPADEPEEYARYLRGRYRSDDGTDLVATAADEQLVAEFQMSLALVAQAERTSLQFRNALEERIATASRLLGSFGRIDWKRSRPSRHTDWKLVVTDLENLIGMISLGTLPLDVDPIEAIDTIRSIHTDIRDGSRRFTPRFKTETPALIGETGETPE